MSTLLRKEWKLVLHPMNVVFLALSAMVLIPSYPYYVTFFYATLGIFMMTQAARENHDIPYMMMLPIRKRDMVKARFLIVVSIELLQALCCVPFLFVRSIYAAVHNPVGVEANWVFLGMGLALTGIYNLMFLPAFYKTACKLGLPFLWSSLVFFLLILIAEALEWAVPWLHRVGEYAATEHVVQQLPVLLVGVLLYGLLTWGAYACSVRRFEKLDI